MQLLSHLNFTNAILKKMPVSSRYRILQCQISDFIDNLNKFNVELHQQVVLCFRNIERSYEVGVFSGIRQAVKSDNTQLMQSSLTLFAKNKMDHGLEKHIPTRNDTNSANDCDVAIYTR